MARYRRVADAVHLDLRTQGRRKGFRLPSVREIAKQRGVSVFTVTRALGLLEMRGIVERRWGVGCFVSADARRAQAVNGTPTIGILMDPQRPPANSWGHSLLEGIVAAIKAEDAKATYVSWREGLALGGEADGLVVGGFVSDAEGDPERKRGILRWLKLASKSGVPVMTVDFGIPEIASVQIDNTDGMARAARYLVDLGHRAIAYMAAAGNRASDERLAGLRGTLREIGVEHDKSLVWTTRPSPHTAYQLFPTYYASHSFTAICCFEDFGAAGVAKAAREMGLRVPGDLSIVGFGNLALGEFAVLPLTTVDVHREDLTRRAVHLLTEMIRTGDVRPAKLRVPGELIVRESTGPAGKYAHPGGLGVPAWPRGASYRRLEDGTGDGF